MLLFKTVSAFALALFVFISVFQSVKMVASCLSGKSSTILESEKRQKQLKKYIEKNSKNTEKEWNPGFWHCWRKRRSNDGGQTIDGSAGKVLKSMENFAKNIDGFKESFSAYVLKEDAPRVYQESVTEMKTLLDKVAKKQAGIVNKILEQCKGCEAGQEGKCDKQNYKLKLLEQIIASAEEYLCESGDTQRPKRATLTEINHEDHQNDAKELAEKLHRSALEAQKSLANIDEDLDTFKEKFAEYVLFDHSEDQHLKKMNPWNLKESVEGMKKLLGEVKIKNGEFRKGLDILNEKGELKQHYGQNDVDRIIETLKAHLCEGVENSQHGNGKVNQVAHGHHSTDGHKDGKSGV